MSTRFKFNNKKIEEIQAPESGQVLYWDEQCRGFGLRVTPGAKTFFAEGRANGRTCRCTIGRFGPFTHDKARALAMELLAQMQQGIDPNKAKAALKAKEKTLGQLFDEYIERKQLRAPTVKGYQAHFGLCFGDWRNKPIAEISKDDVERRYDQLSHGWRAQPVTNSRGTGATLASNGMRLLGSLYSFEMAMHDTVLINPVKRLSLVRRGWSKSAQRQGTITDMELPAFYRGVMQLQKSTSRDYLLLLLLTGLRRSEAAGLQWNDIDFDQECLRIPGERTKNGCDHGLPLPPFLLGLLKERWAAKKKGEEFYVFPGNGSTGHYVESKTSVEYVRERMKEEQMEKDFSPHDLRRTFATVSQKLHVNPREQSKLLNHSKNSDITERYIQAEIEDLRGPMNEINDYLLKAMKAPPPKKSNVSAFKKPVAIRTKKS